MPEVSIKSDLKSAFELGCEHVRRLSARYYNFARLFWDEYSPGVEFEDNWHIEHLCDLLEKEVKRMVRGENKTVDYIINIAPRTLKTFICNVGLTAWAWGPAKAPWIKFIVNTHNRDLSTAHNLAAKRIIESEWYQLLWGSAYDITSDQATKTWFDNSMGGKRIATSTGSGIYGAGFDILVNDDPQDPQTAASEIERENVKVHYGQTLYSRANDQRKCVRINIQQRLHEDDLTGYLLANDPDKYCHICIPSELTEDIHPKELVKFYLDGLMFPSRFGRAQLDEARLPTNMGAIGYACQHLQRPSIPSGNLFKNVWWRFWKFPDQQLPIVQFKDEKNELVTAKVVELPPKFEKIIDSWDTALGGEIGNDDVVGQKWAKLGANTYAIDQIKGKLDYPATRRGVISLCRSNTNTSTVVIEKSSNGPAIEADLKNELPGIKTIPTGPRSKEERVRYSDAVPYQARVESGNVYLPHPAIASWVDGFIQEHSAFPKSAQDGQVDAASQANNFLMTVKYVWPYYQPMDGLSRTSFKIEWHQYRNYGAIVIGKDGRLWFLSGVWDLGQRKLFIYGELVGQSSVTYRHFGTGICNGMNAGKRQITAIVGCKELFSEDKRSVAALVNSEMAEACKAAKILTRPIIREPLFFDERGAIGMVNLMFSRQQIVVHAVVEEASRQFASWYIDKDKPADGFELCRALTLMVSEINRTERVLVKPVPVDGYRKIEEPKREEKNSWQIA
ncbi:MAG: phage terminase large subunit [bacterium]